MIDLPTLCAFFVIGPAVAGVLSWVTQLSVVRDRESRTGQGWDARDTFEIKDSVLGAITWLSPAFVVMAGYTWLSSQTGWHWYAAFLLLLAPFIPFQIWYGRWSVATRKAFEDAAQSKREETSGAR